MYSAGNSVQSVKKTLRYPSRKKDRKLFFDKTNQFNILKRKNILNSEDRELSNDEIQLIKAKIYKQRKKEMLFNMITFIVSDFYN
ncbi:MAG: hypothetical protein WAO74_08235 [Polaribacter sp.]|uniref:hypothetical protein n=1 Tax=Polaribacter sp. TaxID=1920175 RepID=UPI003BB1E9B6